MKMIVFNGIEEGEKVYVNPNSIAYVTQCGKSTKIGLQALVIFTTESVDNVLKKLEQIEQ